MRLFNIANCYEFLFLHDQTKEDKEELKMLCLKQKLWFIINEKFRVPVKKLKIIQNGLFKSTN